MQIQILRRNCDNPRCGTAIDLHVPGLRPTEEAELGKWIILTKEHVLATGQQPQPITKQACSSSCATEIIRNNGLDLPKLEIPKKASAAN